MYRPSAHGEVIALLVVFKTRKLYQDRLLATQVGDTFNFSVYKVNLVGNLSQCFYATFICDCRSSRCNFVELLSFVPPEYEIYMPNSQKQVLR